MTKLNRNWTADRAICDAASAGEWLYNGNEIVAESNVRRGIAGALNDADNEFIAAARTGWPAALDRIAELEAELERINSEDNYVPELLPIPKTPMRRYVRAKVVNHGYVPHVLTFDEPDDDETEALRNHIDMHRRTIDRLGAENARLREAIADIASYPEFAETNNGDRFYEQMRETAKEALK